MTQTDKLYSLQEIEHWLTECNTVGIEPDMARQLAATMRENERLREALEDIHECAMEHGEPLHGTSAAAPYAAISVVCRIALEQRNKDSDNG